MDRTDRAYSQGQDPGSFRDPSSVVLLRRDEVIRGFGEEGFADAQALLGTRFCAKAVQDGRLIRTEPADAGQEGLAGQFAGIVKHPRLPFISYPFEWSFEMLKDAALLTLELMAHSLDEGLTIKDASPYNVQFLGSEPTFIDIGSFERRREGEPWYGYLQFCQMFLYPLMLQAYRDVPFQPWLRSCLEGITPNDARRMISGSAVFRRGVFKHVYLHSKLQAAYSASLRAREVQAELKRAGFTTGLIRSNVSKLTGLIRDLEWKAVRSEWSEYRSAASVDPVNMAAKEAFLKSALAGGVRKLVWDLGANDGHFSAVAASRSQFVLALDSDHLVVDRLYRSLRKKGQNKILPLVLDVANPSPGLGWQGRERAAFLDRGRPDLILMLAVVHHLAITRSLPLGQIVRWLADLGADVVIEFPTPEDPQVQKLLRNKREGIHDCYRTDEFEAALGSCFEISARQALPCGTRVLYYGRPHSRPSIA